MVKDPNAYYNQISREYDRGLIPLSDLLSEMEKIIAYMQ